MNYSPFFAQVSLRVWTLLGAAILLVTMTGCFDIEEEITLNRDGSGSYAMTIDMGELGSMLSSFQDEESEEDGEDPMGSLDSTMMEQAKNLREVPGITNVRHASENFAFTISYDFESIEALNNAQAASAEEDSDAMGGMMGGGMSNGASFSWKSGLFERNSSTSMDDLLGGEEGEEEDESAMEMAKMMFGSANYTTIYHFPNKVKKVSNPSSEISADNRTVTTEISFSDILDGSAELGTKIKYKKK